VPSNIRLTDLFCKLTKSGFCSNFFKYLMCYLYSKKINKTLYLNDIANINSFHLIRETFETAPRVSYVEYRSIDIYQDKIKDLVMYLGGLTEDYIYQEGKAVFKWNKKALDIISKRIDWLPEFDVGVHVRTGDKIISGEMEEITLSSYISAIKDLGLEKSNLNIYLMTDNESVLDKMRAAEPTWNFHILPPPISFKDGHDQKTFNSNVDSAKISAFHHFITELYILQKCPKIICTYSSNIGLFLYITRNENTFIRSLDIQKFSILQHMPTF